MINTASDFSNQLVRAIAHAVQNHEVVVFQLDADTEETEIISVELSELEWIPNATLLLMGEDLDAVRERAALDGALEAAREWVAEHVAKAAQRLERGSRFVLDPHHKRMMNRIADAVIVESAHPTLAFA